MISTRKKKTNDHIEVLVFWDLALHAVCLEHKMTEQELKVLMIMFYIQQTCNVTVESREFTKLFKGDLTYVQRNITRLQELGFVQDTDDGVNVTIQGEYVIRGCSTMLNRHIKGALLPKWTRLKANDERRQFLRKATQNGPQYD